MKKYAIVLLLVIPSCIFIVWGLDVYKDRCHQIIVKSSTLLYKTETDAAYADALNKEKPIAIKPLFPGENVAVKRTTYGKDYWAFKIETSDGTVGWVVAGQEGIEIIRP